MTFHTSSFTSATPGPALYAALEPVLTGVGFTLEDTNVIGARTHKTLKSAAAGNAYGLDWWLDISYPTTGITAGLMMAPFEGFDPATNTGLRGPYGVNDTVIEPAAYSRFGATQHALETNWANQTTYTSLQTTLSTAATTIWASVTRNRVILMTTADAFTHYCGFFTPSAAHASYAGASLFPLITCRVGSGGNALGATAVGSVAAAVTRLPKYTDISATYIPSGGWGGSAMVASSGSMYLSGGIAGQWVHPATGEVAGSPLTVHFGNGTTLPTAATPQTGYVGELDGLIGAYVTATEVRADTLTIGSDTWYGQARSTQHAIFMKGV